MSLNKELKTATLADKAEQLKHRIEHTESKINQIIYELYDLTADEIKIVQGE